jgi:hypothetical protein
MRKVSLKTIRIKRWCWFLVLAVFLILGIEPGWTIYQQTALDRRNAQWIGQAPKIRNLSMRESRDLLNQFFYRPSDEIKVVISLVRLGQEGTINAGQLILVKQMEDGGLPGRTMLRDKSAALFDPRQDYPAIDPDNNPAFRIDRSLWPQSLTIPAGEMVWVTEVHIKHRRLTPLARWMPQLPSQLFCYSFF